MNTETKDFVNDVVDAILNRLIDSETNLALVRYERDQLKQSRLDKEAAVRAAQQVETEVEGLDKARIEWMEKAIRAEKALARAESRVKDWEKRREAMERFAGLGVDAQMKVQEVLSNHGLIRVAYDGWSERVLAAIQCLEAADAIGAFESSLRVKNERIEKLELEKQEIATELLRVTNLARPSQLTLWLPGQREPKVGQEVIDYIRAQFPTVSGAPAGATSTAIDMLTKERDDARAECEKLREDNKAWGRATERAEAEVKALQGRIHVVGVGETTNDVVKKLTEERDRLAKESSQYQNWELGIEAKVDQILQEGRGSVGDFGTIEDKLDEVMRVVRGEPEQGGRSNEP